MARGGYRITAEDLFNLYRCLSSKVCLRIFRIMKKHGKLNVSAISRKAGCGNKTSVKHLRNLARLGIVEEDFHGGFHTFTLKRVEFTELMEQTLKVMEARMRNTESFQKP